MPLPATFRRKAAAVAIIIALSGQAGAAESVLGFDLRASAETVRIQLETKIGVLGNAALSARGNQLLIELSDIDRDELAALVSGLKQKPALVREVRVLPASQKRVRLLIDFAQSITVVDETLVASGKERSRWELVVAPGKNVPAADVPPSVSALEARNRDGRLDLILSGSPSLAAEVFFQDNPPRLLVDLPGVPRAQLEAVAKAWRGGHPLIRGVSVADAGAVMAAGGELVLDRTSNLRRLSHQRYPESQARRIDFVDRVYAANRHLFKDREEASLHPLAAGTRLVLPAETVATASAPAKPAADTLVVDKSTTLRALSHLRFPGSRSRRIEYVDQLYAANRSMFTDRESAAVQMLPAGTRLALPAPAVDTAPKAVEAGAATAGNSRLVFDLTEPADLVDNGGALDGDRGSVLMSIAPDAVSPRKTSGARLGTIAVGEREGQVSLAFSGLDSGRVNAYTLEDPPQLVVDFLGWNPAQVEAAVQGFAPHPAIRSVRSETTRLGSARLVFDLTASAPLLARNLERVPDLNGKSEGLGRTLTLALASPGAKAEGGSLAAAPLDLRYRREPQDRSLPGVLIRAVQLEGRFADGGKSAEAPGKRYGLTRLLEKSLDVDPKYKSAKADYEAASETVPQARAGYLPVAAFDYQHSSVRQNVFQAANSTFPTGASQYPSKSLTLTITQPILKAQAWVKMDQAAVSVEQASLNLVAAEQDLILRVATAYLGLLAAKDNLELAAAEKEATEKNLELARSRLASGLGTITQLHDTEARYALTEAREIDAVNKLDDARQALREIVGENVAEVPSFRADFDASAPMPASADAWIGASREQNLALQVRNLAVQLADLEIQRQQAGYLPTMNLVGTVARQNTGGSIYGNGQNTETRELGVKLNMPLYEGGMTSSLVREAVARREKADQEREAELRRTERVARSAFLSVQSSARTLAALRKSVIAQDSALQSRLEAFRSGVGNLVAVTDAYRLFYSSKRDYLQARYEYLANRLKLKQSVGALSRNDLDDLSALLDN